MKFGSPYNGSGSLTREQFLFYEMRTTAGFIANGMSDNEAIQKILDGNFFQYPTEKSIKRIAKACVTRIRLMKSHSLTQALVSQPTDVAKQICLYAIMKQRRLVWDFMLTVIGEKYRIKDMSFSKMDLNVFFMRLQEQDNNVASWSDTTIQKLKQVLARILVETEYIDNIKADHLNSVLLSPILEGAIRANDDLVVLPAFNRFS